MKALCTFVIVGLLCNVSCLTQSSSKPKTKKGNDMTEKATFAGGCFWCTEAIFQRVEGVEDVVSGYSGGKSPSPSYKEVSSGSSGHAECVQISYHPEVVSYEELLDIFFRTHDPTTLNRQGNDVGPQYRSAIFYHNSIQRDAARAYLAQLREAKTYENPIVTEINAFSNFYEAEISHQDYYELNKTQGYCRFVIAPKIDKFTKAFKSKLKKLDTSDTKE